MLRENDVHRLRVDLSHDTPMGNRLMHELGLGSIPAVVLYDSSGPMAQIEGDGITPDDVLVMVRNLNPATGSAPRFRGGGPGMSASRFSANRT